MIFVVSFPFLPSPSVSRLGKLSTINGNASIEWIVENQGFLGGIALDTNNQHVYFSDFNDGFIKRVDYNGTNMVTLINETQ